MSDYKISWTDTHDVQETKTVIGLDRDGTINKDLGTYVTKPEDFDPIPGSLEAITTLKKYQYQVVIISNQGGIEKGIMSQSDVALVNQRMLELLGKAGCPSIDAIYYSASSHKSDMYAKPNTGMFKRCEKEHKHKNIKFNKGYYVGVEVAYKNMILGTFTQLLAHLKAT